VCKVGYYSGATYVDEAPDATSIEASKEALLDQHPAGDEYTTMSAADESH